MGNDNKAPVAAVEIYQLNLLDNKIFDLDNCPYVPSMRRNLLFVPCLEKLRFWFYFGNEKFVMYKNSEIILKGFKNSDLHLVQLCSNVVYKVPNSFAIHFNDFFLWHLHLDHIGKDRINKLVNKGLLDFIDLKEFCTYENCLYGKMTKLPFLSKARRSKNVLDECKYMEWTSLFYHIHRRLFKIWEGVQKKISIKSILSYMF